MAFNKDKAEVLGWVRVQRTKDGKRTFFPVSFADGSQGILNLDKEKIEAALNGRTLKDKDGNEYIAELGKTTVGRITKSEAFKKKGVAPVKAVTKTPSAYDF